MKHITTCLLFLFLAVTAAAAKADDLATIQFFLGNKRDDAATLHGVYVACLHLTRTGTEEAVPALKELLGDERFSTVARTALVNIPGDAGVKALRESLKTLDGKNLVAVIQTLDLERDNFALSALMRLLETHAGNEEIADAVFTALSKKPTMEAVAHIITKQPHIPGNPSVQRVDAILNYANHLRQFGKERDTREAILFFRGLSQEGSGPGQDAAMFHLIELDEEQGLSRLAALLQEETNISFNVPLRAVLELPSPDTGKTVLDNMHNLPVEKQAALIRNLGARKDSATIVPRLIEMLTQSENRELRLAAASALGEIGDVRAVDAILLAIGAEDAELAEAATESLKLFAGKEFDKTMVTLLDSDDKKLVLAALDVVGARKMVAASDKVKYFLADNYSNPDDEIRAAAYRAFANAAPATPLDIHFVYASLKSRVSEGKNQTSAQEALLALCRKTAEKDFPVVMFAALLNTSSPLRTFYLDCLFELGGEKAAEAIAKAARINDDLADKATQLLGQWTTPDVAPFLIDIAENHLNERYRSRALRGYLRVIRQMGLSVEQKVQMAEKALAVAQSDVDKQQAKEVLTRFQAMRKGTSIFDGKTFNGWEFRDNEKWFRIEEGAIVCGSLKESIPHNEFLVSKNEYGDFTLWIECKVVGHGANGGVQFRSVRTPANGNQPNEMIGYQADMTETANYWGAIYDESRRNRFIAEPPKELIQKIFRPNDWNEYIIVCKGNNVKLYLNGTLTVDYTETDATIPARGFIGLQIHSGPPSECSYRNIRIEE